MDAIMGLAQTATDQPNPPPPYDPESNDTTGQTNANTSESANKKRKLGNDNESDIQSSGTNDKSTTVTNAPENEQQFQWSATNENLAKLFKDVPELQQDHQQQNSSTGESTKGESRNGEASSTAANKSEPSTSSFPMGDAADQTQDTTFTSGVGDDSRWTAGTGAEEGGAGTEDEVLLARNGRPLNKSKRAAQNRQAQRAFRARRDEYVRQTEEKAKLTDEAVETAKKLKSRLDEALNAIKILREDNDALRLGIEALGGQAPPALPFELSGSPLIDTNKDLKTQGEDRKTAEENASDLASLSAVAVAAAASSEANAAKELGSALDTSLPTSSAVDANPTAATAAPSGAENKE
ncbi:uncharacterized protein FA14DRAFT_159476 [Meira miltonrushii]|uniref:BZIP domain-containing protein n=1 Tax=Meira miltonrushii TaxID=1280837 RepID=A0A316VK27_9BASI|nr:uncharacterized protein FA14DRAFT_159476 [Meira miltonrushii]PWN37408.1 hypothetical protein FA14DRAFT_159476 [Meira miltonrushii]